MKLLNFVNQSDLVLSLETSQNIEQLSTKF